MNAFVHNWCRSKRGGLLLLVLIAPKSRNPYVPSHPFRTSLNPPRRRRRTPSLPAPVSTTTTRPHVLPPRPFPPNARKLPRPANAPTKRTPPSALPRSLAPRPSSTKRTSRRRSRARTRSSAPSRRPRSMRLLRLGRACAVCVGEGRGGSREVRRRGWRGGRRMMRRCDRGRGRRIRRWRWSRC